MFVGQKSARPQSNQTQLPNWIDESRLPSVLAIKVRITGRFVLIKNLRIPVLLKAVCPSIFAVLHLEDTALWTKSSTPIPPAISQALSSFQQILVVQAIYPEKLIDALTQFLSRTLGKN